MSCDVSLNETSSKNILQSQNIVNAADTHKVSYVHVACGPQNELGGAETI